VAAPVTRSPHARRFVLVYSALIVAAGVALGGAVAISRTPSPSGPARWPWQPAKGSIDPPQAIAEHVQHEYLASDGRPLFHIQSGGLEENGEPVALAKLVDASTHTVGVYRGETVVYQLCGSASQCTVQPSLRAADALTRRQGLELALYTFRNVDAATNVLVVLPPPARKGASPRAMVLSRDDLAPALHEPLSLPGTPSRLTSSDATTIARKTAPYVYTYSHGKVRTSPGHSQTAVIISGG
jgi:hypothetical protein